MMPAARYMGRANFASKTPGCSPGGRSSWTTFSSRACCMSPSSAVTTPTASSRASTSLRRSARPGVVAVYTAADLGDYWKPGPLLVPPPPIAGLVFNAATQVPLAKDKVRHCGEPLAMVVAESRYLAEDALEDIVVEIEPLPAVMDLEGALAPDAPLVHEQFGSNLAAQVHQSKGDYARPRRAAAAPGRPGGFTTTAAPRRPSRIAASWRSGTSAPRS